MNAYAQRLAELQLHADHELKEIGDQWQTPKPLAFGLFWHFAPKIGPVVLDLFANDGNQLAANYYTAEINAFTQDWAGDLKQFGGAAFANPPYSRPCADEDGTPITGIEHVLQYCREQREQGAKIMLLLKAATSDGWWPEDADFIQFISGRIGFQTPAWYVPRDPKKDKPSSSGFASAVIIFDKEWQGERRSSERLSRHLLETQGQIIIDMIDARATVIADTQIKLLAKESETIPQLEAEAGLESVAESVAEPYQSDDDNYQLPLVAEPEEDFADKTIEQIYAMADETIPLLRIIMLTLLFGHKTKYSHREIQYALTSLLTNGESTNAEFQYECASAIYIAMQEFLRNQEATLQQQHDFVYAMFIHCLQPSAKPLYENVKTLLKIRDAYIKCSGDIEAAIEQLEAGEEVVTEQPNGPASDIFDLADAPDDSELSTEWVKGKCMLIEHFTEFSDEQKQESIDKIIQAIGHINDEFADSSSAKRAEDLIEQFIDLNPIGRTLLNIRCLRAEFRALVQASIKWETPCLEA